AALAERAVARVIAERGRGAGKEARAVPELPQIAPRQAGGGREASALLRETMRGKLAWRGDAIPGLNNDGTVDAALRLEMQIPDFVGFLSDERHAITQILGALDLPGQQLQISAGEIELLTPQRDSRRWGRWRTLGAWL